MIKFQAIKFITQQSHPLRLILNNSNIYAFSKTHTPSDPEELSQIFVSPQFRIKIKEDPMDERKPIKYPRKKKINLKSPKIEQNTFEQIYQRKFFSIKSIEEFILIQSFVKQNLQRLDDKNTINVLCHQLDFLRFQTFCRQEVIDDVRIVYNKFKELNLNIRANYLELLIDLKLTKQVSQEFSLLILEILNDLYQSHQLTVQENIKIFNNCSPLFFFIKNDINFLNETEMTELKIIEYEKTLSITYQQEKQLIDLFQMQVDELSKMYNLIPHETKLRICVIIKKIRIVNYSFLENLCFELQVRQSWKNYEFEDYILFFSVLVRSGNALPYKVLYELRDHLNDSVLFDYSINDSLKILDIMVKSRIRFNDYLTQRLFYAIYNQNQSQNVTISDKIMTLFYYSKHTFFRDQQIQNFFIEQVEKVLDKLNVIQIKIFLHSLADLKITDDQFVLRIRKKVDLHGHIGQLQEFGKLSMKDKVYYEYLLRVISSQQI